jgi:hypothetical protein
MHSLRPGLVAMALLSAWVLGSAAEAHAQQVADPNFDARVAKPAFPDKHPKVLFDEGHFNFHTAGGRYKPFADLITNDGYQVTSSRAKFAKNTLQGYDILVISNALGAAKMSAAKAASPAFTNDECAAVQEWVRAGGSLLLIADHAPMGAAAADLAKRFEVDMSKGFTLDPENYDKASGNEGDLLFTRENKLLIDHAITRGRDAGERIQRVITFVGQSLKGPRGSEAFLKLADTAYDLIPPDRKKVPARDRAQGIALRYGKGRVVVLGEAGCLSAQVVGAGNKPFGMNIPGIDNRQLALNLMHWLSGLLDCDVR